MFFVILVTHPKSYIETTAANRQSVDEDGCYREKFRNFIAWAEPDPKQHFFRYPSTILRTAYRKQFYPNQWHRRKADTPKWCLLLVWRVCDQTFGRYSPWSGHMTVTKIENLHIAHAKIFTDSKNAILFDLWRKVTKLSRKKPFQNSGVTRLLWTLDRLELTLVVNISFFSFDIVTRFISQSAAYFFIHVFKTKHLPQFCTKLKHRIGRKGNWISIPAT